MAVNTGNVEIKACVRDSCTANELPRLHKDLGIVASSAIPWPTPAFSLECPAGFSSSKYPTGPHTTPDAPSDKHWMSASSPI